MLETSCEVCRNEELLKKRMFTALNERGIDPSEFIASDCRQRFDLVVDGFGLRERMVSFSGRDLGEISDLGMIIIKPEGMSAEGKVVSYLDEHLGVRILHRQKFVYLPEEYWQMQGRALFENNDCFLHGALLFLLSICEPSELMIFRHLSSKEYKGVFLAASGGLDAGVDLDSCEDPQRIFTDLFVRDSDGFSIRYDICLPEIEKRGFLTMAPRVCPSVCWDFSSTFCTRSREQNIRTFNGVHSPRDAVELRQNLSVLSRLY